MDATEDRAQVVGVLAFLRSVVKSGEAWSTVCDEEYDKAKRALDRMVRASLAAAPSELPDERLAELRARNRSRGALSIWEIDELFDEIARTRSDAALGAALRDALATVPSEHQLSLYRRHSASKVQGFGALIEDYLADDKPQIENQATEALSVLLSRGKVR